MPDLPMGPQMRHWLIILSAAIAAFMGTLDSYIVNIALPAIARDYRLDATAVSQIILAYLLVVTSTLLFFGKLGDRLGPKKIFLAGYVIFTIGSLFCGLAPDLLLLIVSRCFQALGGAILYAISMSLVPKHLPENMRGMAFGIISTAASLGITLGTPLGGIISAHLNWHWIFFINIPVGLLAVFITWKAVPADEKSIRFRLSDFDYTGTLLSLAGLSLFIIGLSLGRHCHWKSPIGPVCLIASAVLMAVFIANERKHKDPLLDLKVFSRSDLACVNLAYAFCFMLMAGNNFLMPFYLITLKGLRADQAGFIIMIFSAICMPTALICGKLSNRVHPARLCMAGMVIATIGVSFFTFTLGSNGLGAIIWFLIMLGFGFGAFIIAANTLAMLSAPEDKKGVASGLLKTTSNLGLMLGVSLFEMFFELNLPPGALHQGADKTAQLAMISGFRNAYLFGIVVCLSGLVLSTIAASTRSRPAAKQK